MEDFGIGPKILFMNSKVRVEEFLQNYDSISTKKIQ